MVRNEGWPLALSAYLRNKKDAPFEWARNDCATFAADCVMELTGSDPMEKYRKYRTEQGAMRIIKSGDNFIKLISESMGDPHSNTNFAKRGDVVFTMHGACGIVDDSGAKIAILTKDGMRRVPLSHAKLIWSY